MMLAGHLLPAAGRALAALLLALAAVSPATAEMELAAGASAGAYERLTWAAWASWLGQPREQPRWYWRPEATAVAIGSRTADGIRHGSVPLVGAGLRAGVGDFFIGGSLALALADHRTSELSTRRQFISTLGWRRNRVAVVYRHISNGSTGGNNDGENLLAIAVYSR